MIGLSLQHDSRARSSKARLLALFLGFSVFIHGLYYPQEWLLFGFVLSAYALWVHLPKRSDLGLKKPFAFGQTDYLFLGLLFFSLVGILHPVRLVDGLLEALQWGILWLVYRLGIQISSDETVKKQLMQYIEWLAVGIALIGWLPWVSKVGGRLSSVFGYPNAAAAFLGAVLLIHPRRRLIFIWLAISLLGTGSRGAVGLFLIVFIGRLWIGRTFQSKVTGRINYFKGMVRLLVGGAGTALMLCYYRPAWENLTAWGFSTSSWQERLIYFKDGLKLAWNSGGLPQAGGWWAFPTVQTFPYWTADPHSGFIHILLNQGVPGLMGVGIWGGLVLAQAWMTWRNNRMPANSRLELEESKTRLQVCSALIFLVLHSLVDADFSFGALGSLFWLLFGSLQIGNDPFKTNFSKPNQLLYSVGKMGILGLSLTVFLSCGAGLLKPALLKSAQIWNAQAVQYGEQNPNKSSELWGRSLKWDQTQIEARREVAEYLLQTGNLEAGLESVKEVLSWQPFELGAYEWGQSVVWDAAEVYRQEHPETVMLLYRWVENVPGTIEGRLVNLNSSERRLWQGHKNFLPSQHIQLLAEYARQRQLTQLLP
ncbi:O-antigen ligase family protein [Desulfosporosinus youngiae]|uniref:Lipid A core-O-antigen ligase-like enyme n=1 Tax=Desulfosporosinus youngiae DSM 17734 TaxID=768710 RepID=H5Y0J1_9FIRM|nr:O-antigen ligase family protein [Desulfosporosinus youngiae]EHQ92247.1 hypothetical protein DesyoDRAFT_5319 [Desulfosporosinus youngiae DSM 17734]